MAKNDVKVNREVYFGMLEIKRRVSGDFVQASNLYDKQVEKALEWGEHHTVAFVQVLNDTLGIVHEPKMDNRKRL